MTDQQRGDTVLPNSATHMPHVAQLRDEGVAFSEAFCPSPHCCPSRATFFTGMYPAQHGVWNNVDVGNALSRGLAPGVRTWCESFRDAGYRMRYTGKWHISQSESPVDRGWEVLPGTQGDYAGRGIRQTSSWAAFEGFASEPVQTKRGEGQILRPGFPPFTQYGVMPDRANGGDLKTVQPAIDAIESMAGDDDQPWCVYVGPHGPHDPYFPPQHCLDQYDLDDIALPASFADDLRDKPNFYRRTRDLFDQLTEREHRESIRHYRALCTYEDELFGRLLAKLDETGQADNTLVIYCSDHGDYNAEHGLWCKGMPCFRGGYHVPIVMRWPRGITNPGRIVDDFVSLADFTPTLLDVADLPAIDDETSPLVGRSLVPFLRDESPDVWRDAVHTQTNGNELYAIQRSIRTRTHSYVYNGFDYDELYDLQADPHEMINLANSADHADTRRQLMRRIWQFGRDTGDLCTNSYIMVRFAEFGPGEAFVE